MKTDSLTRRTLTENGAGIGTVTRGIVRERAVELAIIAGHPAQDVSVTEWGLGQAGTAG